MASEEAKRKKIEYNEQYRKDNLQVFLVKAQKGLNIQERIEAQVKAGTAPSKQAYIIDAVLQKLEQDEQQT